MVPMYIRSPKVLLQVENATSNLTVVLRNLDWERRSLPMLREKGSE